MAVAYAASTMGYSVGAVSSWNMTIPSNASAVYVALVFGVSAISDVASITQTNVTWTFQAWVQNVNGSGKSVECWIGIPSGTPATSGTILNNASCQQAASVYLFTGIAARTDVIEHFWVASKAGNQVTFPSFGTGGPAAVVQSCMIISPSGTAISGLTGTGQLYQNFGSQPYGMGQSQSVFASAAGFNGGTTWSENSSYGQILATVVLKGFTGIGIQLQSAANKFLNLIIAGGTAPPWTYQVANWSMWSQFTQAILIYQYFSTSAVDQGTMSMPNMNFYFLGAAPVLQPVAGHYLHLELWICYPNGNSNGSGTAPTLTFSAGSRGRQGIRQYPPHVLLRSGWPGHSFGKWRSANQFQRDRYVSFLDQRLGCEYGRRFGTHVGFAGRELADLLQLYVCECIGCLLQRTLPDVLQSAGVVFGNDQSVHQPEHCCVFYGFRCGPEGSRRQCPQYEFRRNDYSGRHDRQNTCTCFCHRDWNPGRDR